MPGHAPHLVLHGLRVVAALKLRLPLRRPRCEGSPRPSGRGRIEATVMVGSASTPKGSPRPSGRGRIEALPHRSFYLVIRRVLHGLRVVAALKPRLKSGAETAPCMGSPRPSGRGRIEAHPWGEAEEFGSRRSPRPSGRGRIEARRPPSACTPASRSPRPSGRGRIEAALGAIANQLQRRRSPRPSGRGRIEATARTGQRHAQVPGFSTAFGSWPH